MRILRLIKREDGIALVMVMGTLMVLAIAGTTVTLYSTSNARTVNRSAKDELSFSLSEAGLNNAMAVLSNPTNNPLDPDTLPSSEATASSAQYENGTVKWWGVLDRAAAVWTVTALGIHNSASPSTAAVRRSLTARVPIVPVKTQTEENAAWNYIYARRTGNACDMTVNNNILGSSRLYVVGNLCVHNGATIANGPLIVRGNLDMTHKDSTVGSATSMSTRVETYVGGNCRRQAGSWAIPCTGDQDSRQIYSKRDPSSYVVGVNNNAPFVAEPVADFVRWYENGIPGPSQSCTATSGTPPTFDTNYPLRDTSAPLFELTAASSYTCRVGPGASSTLTSALNATQTTMTVASAVGFPTSPFRLRIDSEYLDVTAGFGTTSWAVTRGVNGSTAASHIVNETASWDTPASGELSWNASAKKLTVQGTVFIDGSVRATNGQVNSYDGQGALYVSGTFVVDSSTKLCASVSGSTCDFSGWDPNKEMLTVAANGADGSGYGIVVNSNSAFQGALYASQNIYLNNNVSVDGPVVGNNIVINNAVTAHSFPTVVSVPVGMPGDETIYAQPNPPQMFAG
jgi:Tfp pilus assembly protein PilX